MGIDLWNTIVWEGGLGQHFHIFLGCVFQMENVITALLEISEFARMDKGLGIEPLQGMLIAPIDRHRVRFKGIGELFRGPPRRHPILKSDVEPTLAKHL